MRQHALYSWVCTDTVVGLFVSFLDKRPVAISTQTARKNILEIQFIDQESYNFVKKVVSEYQRAPELEFVDLDTEIPVEWSNRAQGQHSFNIENTK